MVMKRENRVSVWEVREIKKEIKNIFRKEQLKNL